MSRANLVKIDAEMQLHGGAYLQFPEDPQAYAADKAEAVLKSLFHAAVLHTEDRIKWYEQKAGLSSKVAKRIRFWSLLLFAVGTLAPIAATFVLKLHEPFAGTGPNEASWLRAISRLPYAEIGYVLLALA